MWFLACLVNHQLASNQVFGHTRQLIDKVKSEETVAHTRDEIGPLIRLQFAGRVQELVQHDLTAC